MKHLVAGYGEVGKAVGAVLGEHDWLDVDMVVEKKQYDVLHVCFPYSENFVSSVQQYIQSFSPQHVVIYSTVPIGITRQIPGAVHSPVEGKHPDLEMSIRQMERWIGHNDKTEGLFFVNLFQDLGLRTRLVASSDWTEALKLLSTTEYGLNIEFARYKKQVADGIGMDYELAKDWNRIYNRLYKNLGLDGRYQKFVLDAPIGLKGGHCITPNAQLLNKQFPNRLVGIVGEEE